MADENLYWFNNLVGLVNIASKQIYEYKGFKTNVFAFDEWIAIYDLFN